MASVDFQEPTTTFRRPQLSLFQESERSLVLGVLFCPTNFFLRPFHFSQESLVLGGVLFLTLTRTFIRVNLANLNFRGKV